MFENLESVSTSARSSKYFDLLSREEREMVKGFGEWLVKTHEFKSESASSYRSNLARANFKLGNNEEITSDERTAVRKFREFCDELVEFLVASGEINLDDDDIVDDES